VPTASTLLAEELFASADPRFLSAIYDVQVPRGTIKKKGWGGRPFEVPSPFERGVLKSHPLGAFATRWLEDPRPWAREQLLAYVSDGCDRAGHRPLVKRLYKGAEDRGDHELVALFLVAFDRMRRLRTRTRKTYDWTTRTVVDRTEVRAVKPRTSGAFHFSQRTRSYLQARAARHLRGLGTREPIAYRRAVLEAVTRYEDADFPAGLSLLRMRGLLNVLFAHSDVLARFDRRVGLASGKTLADLSPAPHHPEAWKAAVSEVLDTLPRTRSLFLRRQLVRWLERDFATSLASIDIARVQAFLASSHPDVQLFGAGLLEKAVGVENLLLDEWLALLASDEAEVLPLIVAKMSAAVTPARATLEQCVALARHVAYAPAMLGIEWTETKDLHTKAELEVALPVVDATVREARMRGVAFLTPALLNEELGHDAHLREILDSRHADVREKGFELLEETPRFRDSIVLWAALTESPHADARAFLLSLLARRRVALEATTLGDKSLHHLWATTILEVNRGSRAKQRALTQLGERLESQPQQADELLPLLSLALRSVRETERRGALSSLVRAAARRPEVRDAIARHAPEIQIVGLGPLLTAGGPG
jgi:hypothetical protein